VHGLEFFFLPDVVRALSPAVRAALVDAISAFELVKPSALAHEQTLSIIMIFSSSLSLGFLAAYTINDDLGLVVCREKTRTLCYPLFQCERF
jgi:hypothetical protein